MKAAKTQHPANRSILGDSARVIRRGGQSRILGTQDSDPAKSREGIPAGAGARADSRTSRLSAKVWLVVLCTACVSAQAGVVTLSPDPQFVPASTTVMFDVSVTSLPGLGGQFDAVDILIGSLDGLQVVGFSYSLEFIAATIFRTSPTPLARISHQGIDRGEIEDWGESANPCGRVATRK